MVQSPKMSPSYLLSIVLKLIIHTNIIILVHVCMPRIITHSVRAFDAQQFLVVLIRCGGSKKKKNCLASMENGLRTWLTSLLFLLCNCTNLRLTEAPSKVAPIT